MEALRLRPVAAVAAAALLMTGCGGDGRDGTSRTAPTVTAAPGHVNVVGKRVADAEKILRANGWRKSDGTTDLERTPLGGSYLLTAGRDEGDWLVCHQSYSELVDGSEDVYLRAGPSCVVAIPNAIGRTLAEAEQLGDELGILTWPESVDPVYSSTADLYRDWIVCEQDPPPAARKSLADDSWSFYVGAARPGHCPP